MGNFLIIKGVDFSENAVEHVEFYELRQVTPSFINGSGVLASTGEVITTQHTVNQKYCIVSLNASDKKIKVRATGSTNYGIAFFNGSTYIEGYAYNDFDLHTIIVPTNATSFRYSYLTDSRAIELEKPIVSSIDIFFFS